MQTVVGEFGAAADVFDGFANTGLRASEANEVRGKPQTEKVQRFCSREQVKPSVTAGPAPPTDHATGLGSCPLRTLGSFLVTCLLNRASSAYPFQ